MAKVVINIFYGQQICCEQIFYFLFFYIIYIHLIKHFICKQIFGKTFIRYVCVYVLESETKSMKIWYSYAV